MRGLHCVILSAVIVSTTLLGAQTQPAATANQKDWIKRSNAYAQVLLKVQAKYAPEFAARQGVVAPAGPPAQSGDGGIRRNELISERRCDLDASGFGSHWQ